MSEKSYEQFRRIIAAISETTESELESTLGNVLVGVAGGCSSDCKRKAERSVATDYSAIAKNEKMYLIMLCVPAAGMIWTS